MFHRVIPWGLCSFLPFNLFVRHSCSLYWWFSFNSTVQLSCFFISLAELSVWFKEAKGLVILIWNNTKIQMESSWISEMCGHLTRYRMSLDLWWIIHKPSYLNNSTQLCSFTFLFQYTLISNFVISCCLCSFHVFILVVILYVVHLHHFRI